MDNPGLVMPLIVDFMRNFKRDRTPMKCDSDDYQSDDDQFTAANNTCNHCAGMQPSNFKAIYNIFKFIT